MVRLSILAEVMKIAFASIWSHKLRTFLTLLGIIVGAVGLVILVALSVLLECLRDHGLRRRAASPSCSVSCFRFFGCFYF